MSLLNQMQVLNPEENKKIYYQTTYFSYFSGKLVATTFTRKNAIKALRKAKKQGRRTYWGNFDYIIVYGEKKTYIHPDKF